MPYRTVGPPPYSVGHADSLTFKVCQLIAHMHGARAPGRDDIFGETLGYLFDSSITTIYRLAFLLARYAG
jgi:hypothetical protein